MMQGKAIKRKKVLVLCYSNLNSDPRVLRQIEALKEIYDIYTAGFKASGLEGRGQFIHIGDTLNFPDKAFYKPFKFLVKLYRAVQIKFMNQVFKNYFLYYWDISKVIDLLKLKGHSFDIIVANDINTLPLAVQISKNAKVYFDAHEYAPLEYENDLHWLKYEAPFLLHTCSKYIPLADYCTTVSHNLALKYQELTSRAFDVVYNAPHYQGLNITAPSGSIRCVHHGVASPIRNIEAMIDAFISLGTGYELNLLLVKNDAYYYEQMVNRAKGHSNIIFHPPVPTKEIPGFINKFDISLIFIPPVNFNYKYCLPNKFFESIQARLMLLCGPSPEMEILVSKYNLGHISTGFESEDIKNSLQKIDKNIIEHFKMNAERSSHLLSAETSMQLLTENIEKLCVE